MICDKCGEELCPSCDGRGWVDDPNGGTMCCPLCNCEPHNCNDTGNPNIQ